jgi:hypothetical protein
MAEKKCGCGCGAKTTPKTEKTEEKPVKKTAK